MPRRITATVIGVLTIMATLLGLSMGTASAATPGELASGQRLEVGAPLYSLNHTFQLAVQSDGNMVESRVSDGKVLWSSNTAGQNRSDVFAVLGQEGSLVVYANSQPLWSSNTNGDGAKSGRLVVEDSGRMVVYRDQAPVWKTLAASEVVDKRSYSGSANAQDKFFAEQWAESNARSQAPFGATCDFPQTNSYPVSAPSAAFKSWAANVTLSCLVSTF